uniref:Ig-like domain-containing protein n=1 Tax=Otus sunia TaxID=257818 RepID=A0A8C8B2G6_9STRI
MVLLGLCPQTVQSRRVEKSWVYPVSPFAFLLCCLGCFANECSSFSVSPVPPEFIQGSGSTSNVSISLQGSLTLTCEATGIPLPTVTWSWNGSPVTSSEHTHVLSGQGQGKDAVRDECFGNTFCPNSDGFKHGGAPALQEHCWDGLMPGSGP